MHSVVPHLLLPPLLFLPFYLPPFPFRNVVFGTATVGLIAANTINTFPAERTLRYGLSGVWIVYFPVLEKLFLHQTPEHDFWRLDREPHEAERMRPFSLDKARWALSLLTSLRGAGWSHGSKRIPQGDEGKQSSLAFILAQSKRVLVSNLAIEAVLLLCQAIRVPMSWSLRDLPSIVLIDLLMGVTVWATWTLQYGVAAIASVSVGLSKAKDWPPIFGSITEADSIAGFWGSFWHGILRQPSLCFSKFLILSSGLAPRREISYVIHVMSAFCFSSLWHVVSIATIADGHISIWDVSWGLSAFFMGQIPAIVAEHALLRLKPRKLPETAEKKASNQGNGINRQRSFWGYVRTFSWLGLTGWFFVHVYRSVGLMETEHPFPVLGPALRTMGLLAPPK